MPNHHSRKDPLAQGDAAAILLYTNLFLRHCHPQAEKGGPPPNDARRPGSSPLSDAGLQELSPTLNQSNAGFSVILSVSLLCYFAALRRLQMITATPAAANAKIPP